MLFGTEPTQEEKIDYIYTTLRNQKRKQIFKLIIILSIISYLYFNIGTAIVSGDTVKIKTAIQEQIKEMVIPIVQEASKSVLQNQNTPSSNSDVEKLKADALKLLQQGN